LTKSTMEAELTALDTAFAEAEWLCELLYVWLAGSWETNIGDPYELW
jgi:hypothetical protein